MDCFSQCKGEVIAHTSHSLTVLETLHSLSACMTSPPRVALLTVFHQSYGSNGDLINKNTSCVVFHVVLSVRGHCSVWVCVCVCTRPCGVHMYTSKVLQLAGSVAQLRLGRMTFVSLLRDSFFSLWLRGHQALDHCLFVYWQTVILFLFFYLTSCVQILCPLTSSWFLIHFV